MTTVTLAGGTESVSSPELTYFKLGDYSGEISQSDGTVTILVPEGFDVSNLTPEAIATAGATVSPAGPQNFSSPVTYEIASGDFKKSYIVNVVRGYDITFNLYGGTVSGSSADIVYFVAKGLPPAAPATAPTRTGYVFSGWSTDRSGNAVDLSALSVSGPMTLYAIWGKDANPSITSNADAAGKTWQTEKNSNYGSAGTMLVRQPANTDTNGLFGEKFTTTSTSDGTDMKTSFIRFNVEELRSQNVNSVKLAVNYAGSENGTAASSIILRVARAASSWTENTVTWVTRPTVYIDDGVMESASFSTTGAKVIEIDVTSLYNKLPEGETQITFAISANSATRDYQITSKEGSATLAPKLIFDIATVPDPSVTYVLNGKIGTAPIQPTLATGKDFAAAASPGILFLEWNTKPDGTGDSYKAGALITVPETDLALYAIWAQAKSIVAGYDDTGILVGVKEYDSALATGQPSQADLQELANQGAAYYRAFQWNDDSSPVTDSLVIIPN
jgi:uncharacterized repeat protein (TIGR02543 family)